MYTPTNTPCTKYCSNVLIHEMFGGRGGGGGGCTLVFLTQIKPGSS